MEFSWLWQFLSDHFGELVLGLEFLLINLSGKKPKLSKEAKAALKKEKMVTKKKFQAAKALEKAQKAMSDIADVKEEV